MSKIIQPLLSLSIHAFEFLVCMFDFSVLYVSDPQLPGQGPVLDHGVFGIRPTKKYKYKITLV